MWKLKVLEQTQLTGPANQSTHISYFGRRGFIEAKWRVWDRLGGDVLQSFKIYENIAFLEQSNMKTYSSTHKKSN